MSNKRSYLEALTTPVSAPVPPSPPPEPLVCKMVRYESNRSSTPVIWLRITVNNEISSIKTGLRMPYDPKDIPKWLNEDTSHTWYGDDYAVSINNDKTFAFISIYADSGETSTRICMPYDRFLSIFTGPPLIHKVINGRVVK